MFHGFHVRNAQACLYIRLAIHPIQFHCGDDLHHEMLAKANRFLMQIVTNQPIELHETMVAGVHEEHEG